MSDAVGHHTVAHLGTSNPLSDLRGRIGWICHTLRLAAVAWIGWGFVNLVFAWSDRTRMTEAWGRLFSTDLSGISDARYTAAFAISLVDLAVAATVVVCIWRLSATYLAGRVFTIDAALWLRRTGIAGLVAIAVDLLARVAAASILTGQFVPIPSARGFYYILPHDLLHLVFIAFVLALAHIFKAAAEMADDHAQIV